MTWEAKPPIEPQARGCEQLTSVWSVAEVGKDTVRKEMASNVEPAVAEALVALPELLMHFA